MATSNDNDKPVPPPDAPPFEPPSLGGVEDHNAPAAPPMAPGFDAPDNPDAPMAPAIDTSPFDAPGIDAPEMGSTKIEQQRKPLATAIPVKKYTAPTFEEASTEVQNIIDYLTNVLNPLDEAIEAFRKLNAERLKQQTRFQEKATKDDAEAQLKRIESEGERMQEYIDQLKENLYINRVYPILVERTEKSIDDEKQATGKEFSITREHYKIHELITIMKKEAERIAQRVSGKSDKMAKDQAAQKTPDEKEKQDLEQEKTLLEKTANRIENLQSILNDKVRLYYFNLDGKATLLHKVADPQDNIKLTTAEILKEEGRQKTLPKKIEDLAKKLVIWRKDFEENKINAEFLYKQEMNLSNMDRELAGIPDVIANHKIKLKELERQKQFFELKNRAEEAGRYLTSVGKDLSKMSRGVQGPKAKKEDKKIEKEFRPDSQFWKKADSSIFLDSKEMGDLSQFKDKDAYLENIVSSPNYDKTRLYQILKFLSLDEHLYETDFNKLSEQINLKVIQLVENDKTPVSVTRGNKVSMIYQKDFFDMIVKLTGKANHLDGENAAKASSKTWESRKKQPIAEAGTKVDQRASGQKVSNKLADTFAALSARKDSSSTNETKADVVVPPTGNMSPEEMVSPAIERIVSPVSPQVDVVQDNFPGAPSAPPLEGVPEDSKEVARAPVDLSQAANVQERRPSEVAPPSRKKTVVTPVEPSRDQPVVRDQLPPITRSATVVAEPTQDLSSVPSEPRRSRASTVADPASSNVPQSRKTTVRERHSTVDPSMRIPPASEGAIESPQEVADRQQRNREEAKSFKEVTRRRGVAFLAENVQKVNEKVHEKVIKIEVDDFVEKISEKLKDYLESGIKNENDGARFKNNEAKIKTEVKILEKLLVVLQKAGTITKSLENDFKNELEAIQKRNRSAKSTFRKNENNGLDFFIGEVRGGVKAIRDKIEAFEKSLPPPKDSSKKRPSLHNPQ